MFFLKYYTNAYAQCVNTYYWTNKKHFWISYIHSVTLSIVSTAICGLVQLPTCLDHLHLLHGQSILVFGVVPQHRGGRGTTIPHIFVARSPPLRQHVFHI
jgi:hypothetical protein